MPARGGSAFGGNYIGVWTLIKKELVRFVRVPIQTIGSPVITSLLYFAVFGAAVGSRIGDMNGLTYSEFITPGLIMMNVIMVSFTGISSGIQLAKLLNTLNDILIAPFSNLEIIMGFSIASVLRTMFTATLIYLVALFFIPFHITHFFYLLTFTALVAFFFSLLGIIIGVWSKDFEQIMVLPTFLITPLTFLGGVFYSTDMLPPMFKAISHWNPILYSINGLRYGFYGVTDVSPFFAYMLFIVLTLATLAFAHHLFKIGYKIRT